jgi:ribonuclease T
VYDAERTAELFCSVVNRWRQLELFEQAHSGLDAA